MTTILTESAAVGNATARTLIFRSRGPKARFFDDRQWMSAFPGGDYRWLRDGGNDDGSVDLLFGPEAPEANPENWIQTLAGKSWCAVFRLYGPLDPWFDGEWKPGDIEPCRPPGRRPFGPGCPARGARPGRSGGVEPARAAS